MNFDEEDERLTRAVVDALAAAREGKAGKGYAVLQQGIERARQAQQSGYAWAADILACYEEVLCRYHQRYRSLV